MVEWAKRSGLNAALLESYIQKGGTWQDFVGIFIKDNRYTEIFPSRILDTKNDFENGLVGDKKDLLNPSFICQNDRKLIAINQISSEQIIVN